MDKYKNFLKEHILMSSDDADLFLSGFEEVNYKKGDLLLEFKLQIQIKRNNRKYI